jgi:hypothetical protein
VEEINLQCFYAEPLERTHAPDHRFQVSPCNDIPYNCHLLSHSTMQWYAITWYMRSDETACRCSVSNTALMSALVLWFCNCCEEPTTTMQSGSALCRHACHWWPLFRTWRVVAPQSLFKMCAGLLLALYSLLLAHQRSSRYGAPHKPYRSHCTGTATIRLLSQAKQ